MICVTIAFTAMVNERQFVPAANVRIADIAILFLKLGFLAFGGPAAHIALMEDEVVHRRGWMSREEFLDLLGAANLIPGPSSTELAIYIGYRLSGGAGLLLAGMCFILPAALMVCGLAALYVRWGAMPIANTLFQSLYPVVIAIVVQALWRLGRTALKSLVLSCIAVGAVGMAWAQVSPLLVLLAGGTVAAIYTASTRQASKDPASLSEESPPIAAPLVAAPLLSSVASTIAPVGLMPLFLVFLKFGAVIFGSGYVLLPFLQADLVTQRHWMTERQLLDAILIGQVTPGPVFTTATFIGYLLGRGPGAMVATAGIFLPAFALVAMSGPLVPRIRRSKCAGAFLDGLNVAALALMAAVTFQLGHEALRHPLSWALALMSAMLLLLTRINALWLIAAAGIIGVVFANQL